MSRGDLARSYRLAARTTRREAGNFYIAFLSLPRAERRAVYALYAFFRELDDAADGAPGKGGIESEGESHFLHSVAAAADPRSVGIARMRERLARASAGEPESSRDLALADTIERFSIDVGDLDDVICGVETDLGPVEMQTLEELEDYAYLVASAVGLATLAILNCGVPPTDEMRERAVRLGLGMQLVNVVRDVGEDASQYRIYVPQELLARHGARRASIDDGVVTPELRAALAELGSRARGHLRAGRELMPRVPRSSRACLWLLSEVYDRILTRIEEARYDVFAGRISLPTGEKLWLLASARCRI